MDGNQECENEVTRADKFAKEARRRAGECDKAKAALDKQQATSSGNENKMGQQNAAEDKPAASGGDSGGGGGAPQMPQPPPPNDSAAKAKECKAMVTSNLAVNQKNCESKFPFDPAHPVDGQKQKQDECKQNEIFNSQSETAKCG